jgi:hypothetical protein
MFQSSEVEKRRLIVLIGFADSIHLARWVEILAHAGCAMVIISSSASNIVHPNILTLIQTHPNVRLAKMASHKVTSAIWVMDKMTSNWLRGALIAVKLIRLRPAVVHVLETQNGGYPTERAYSLLPPRFRPPLVLTSYGSDFYWFGRFEAHARRITRVLKRVAILCSECSRDFKFASDHGFRGEESPIRAITGGLSQADLAGSRDTIPRTRITIKGNLGQWGRGDLALLILEDLMPLLPKLTVTVYSANDTMEALSRSFAQRNGWELEVHREGVLGHQQLLNIFRESLAYIGMSRSDGAATSCLEAMSQGAFPIQSNTACSAEWFTHGVSGYSMPSEKFGPDVSKIAEILNDEFSLRHARTVNREVILTRYNKDEVLKQAVDLYRRYL